MVYISTHKNGEIKPSETTYNKYLATRLICINEIYRFTWNKLSYNITLGYYSVNTQR